MENSGPIQKHVIDWNDTDFFRWPGLRLISAEDGVSRVELLVEKHHRGGGGSPNAINGGIVSYMFDALLGAAVASTWDEITIGQAWRWEPRLLRGPRVGRVWQDRRDLHRHLPHLPPSLANLSDRGATRWCGQNSGQAREE